ncbi:hypothetical protein BDV29DRAFT_181604 [Aspergillus leporis]|jgi:hypothetical protein|uniref:Uncharacterized protein n=1 Tax=Aspergillus leporis TaxID=41062 RepID=A0A5N5WNC4_9EURO|nr:hypothetical protein BDV29DRAFT_181604 [Aspergillus leporis]
MPRRIGLDGVIFGCLDPLFILGVIGGDQSLFYVPADRGIRKEVHRTRVEFSKILGVTTSALLTPTRRLVTSGIEPVAQTCYSLQYQTTYASIVFAKHCRLPVIHLNSWLRKSLSPSMNAWMSNSNLEAPT